MAQLLNQQRRKHEADFENARRQREQHELNKTTSSTSPSAQNQGPRSQPAAAAKMPSTPGSDGPLKTPSFATAEDYTADFDSVSDIIDPQSRSRRSSRVRQVGGVSSLSVSVEENILKVDSLSSIGGGGVNRVVEEVSEGIESVGVGGSNYSNVEGAGNGGVLDMVDEFLADASGASIQEEILTDMPKGSSDKRKEEHSVVSDPSITHTAAPGHLDTNVQSNPASAPAPRFADIQLAEGPSSSYAPPPPDLLDLSGLDVNQHETAILMQIRSSDAKHEADLAMWRQEKYRMLQEKQREIERSGVRREDAAAAAYIELQKDGDFRSKENLERVILLQRDADRNYYQQHLAAVRNATRQPRPQMNLETAAVAVQSRGIDEGVQTSFVFDDLVNEVIADGVSQSSRGRETVNQNGSVAIQQEFMDSISSIPAPLEEQSLQNAKYDEQSFEDVAEEIFASRTHQDGTSVAEAIEIGNDVVSEARGGKDLLSMVEEAISEHAGTATTVSNVDEVIEEEGLSFEKELTPRASRTEVPSSVVAAPVVKAERSNVNGVGSSRQKDVAYEDDISSFAGAGSVTPTPARLSATSQSPSESSSSLLSISQLVNTLQKLNQKTLAERKRLAKEQERMEKAREIAEELLRRKQESIESVNRLKREKRMLEKRLEQMMTPGKAKSATSSPMRQRPPVADVADAVEVKYSSAGSTPKRKKNTKKDAARRRRKSKSASASPAHQDTIQPVASSSLAIDFDQENVSEIIEEDIAALGRDSISSLPQALETDISLPRDEKQESLQSIVESIGAEEELRQSYASSVSEISMQIADSEADAAKALADAVPEEFEKSASILEDLHLDDSAADIVPSVQISSARVDVALDSEGVSHIVAPNNLRIGKENGREYEDTFEDFETNASFTERSQILREDSVDRIQLQMSIEALKRRIAEKKKTAQMLREKKQKTELKNIEKQLKKELEDLEVEIAELEDSESQLLDLSQSDALALGAQLPASSVATVSSSNLKKMKGLEAPTASDKVVDAEPATKTDEPREREHVQKATAAQENLSPVRIERGALPSISSISLNLDVDEDRPEVATAHQTGVEADIAGGRRDVSSISSIVQNMSLAHVENTHDDAVRLSKQQGSISDIAEDIVVDEEIYSTSFESHDSHLGLDGEGNIEGDLKRASIASLKELLAVEKVQEPSPNEAPLPVVEKSVVDHVAEEVDEEIQEEISEQIGSGETSLQVGVPDDNKPSLVSEDVSFAPKSVAESVVQGPLPDETVETKGSESMPPSASVTSPQIPSHESISPEKQSVPEIVEDDVIEEEISVEVEEEEDQSSPLVVAVTNTVVDVAKSVENAAPEPSRVDEPKGEEPVAQSLGSPALGGYDDDFDDFEEESNKGANEISSSVAIVEEKAPMVLHEPTVKDEKPVASDVVANVPTSGAVPDVSDIPEEVITEEVITDEEVVMQDSDVERPDAVREPSAGVAETHLADNRMAQSDDNKMDHDHTALAPATVEVVDDAAMGDISDIIEEIVDEGEVSPAEDHIFGVENSMPDQESPSETPLAVMEVDHTVKAEVGNVGRVVEEEPRDHSSPPVPSVLDAPSDHHQYVREQDMKTENVTDPGRRDPKMGDVGGNVDEELRDHSSPPSVLDAFDVSNRHDDIREQDTKTEDMVEVEKADPKVDVAGGTVGSAVDEEPRDQSPPSVLDALEVSDHVDDGGEQNVKTKEVEVERADAEIGDIGDTADQEPRDQSPPSVLDALEISDHHEDSREQDTKAEDMVDVERAEPEVGGVGATVDEEPHDQSLSSVSDAFEVSDHHQDSHEQEMKTKDMVEVGTADPIVKSSEPKVEDGLTVIKDVTISEQLAQNQYGEVPTEPTVMSLPEAGIDESGPFTLEAEHANDLGLVQTLLTGIVEETKPVDIRREDSEPKLADESAPMHMEGLEVAKVGQEVGVSDDKMPTTLKDSDGAFVDNLNDEQHKELEKLARLVDPSNEVLDTMPNQPVEAEFGKGATQPPQNTIPTIIPDDKGPDVLSDRHCILDIRSFTSFTDYGEEVGGGDTVIEDEGDDILHEIDLLGGDEVVEVEEVEVGLLDLMRYSSDEADVIAERILEEEVEEAVDVMSKVRPDVFGKPRIVDEKSASSSTEEISQPRLQEPLAPLESSTSPQTQLSEQHPPKAAGDPSNSLVDDITDMILKDLLADTFSGQNQKMISAGAVSALQEVAEGSSIHHANDSTTAQEIPSNVVEDFNSSTTATVAVAQDNVHTEQKTVQTDGKASLDSPTTPALVIKSEELLKGSEQFVNFALTFLDSMPAPTSSTGRYSSAPLLSREVLESMNARVESSDRRIQNTLIFDSINEALSQIFRPFDKSRTPHNKLRACPHIQPSPLTRQAVVDKVCDFLRQWSGYSEQHGENLDAMLIKEVKDDERDSWLDLGDSRVEVQMRLVEALWDGLLEDTVYCLNEVTASKNKFIEN
ncbi:hypothetical protein HK102_012644 [Quaeritorhiza haematococci]|nr:hypothetical protein HK102_012644 [Quaeritorhiza haematococci]